MKVEIEGGDRLTLELSLNISQSMNEISERICGMLASFDKAATDNDVAADDYGTIMKSGVLLMRRIDDGFKDLVLHISSGKDNNPEVANACQAIAFLLIAQHRHTDLLANEIEEGKDVRHHWLRVRDGMVESIEAMRTAIINRAIENPPAGAKHD